MFVKKLAIFLSVLCVLASSVESGFAATSCLSILDRQKRVLTTSADQPYVLSGPLHIYLKADCSIPKKTHNNPKPKAVIEVDRNGVTVDKIKIEHYVVFNNGRRSDTRESWFNIDNSAFEYRNRYQTAADLKHLIFNSVTEDAKITFSINKSYVGEDANVLDEIVLFVTKAANHDSIPTPTISISGDGAVTEGSAATFTLTASPAPESDLTVTVEVTDSGNFAASDTAGVRRVTIPTSGSAQLDVDTEDDNTEEPNGSVTATVRAGQGYTVASASSATVAVSDNDDPPPVTPVVTIAGGTAVTEGGGAVFTLTAVPAPSAALTVKLNVTEAAGSDFVASGQEGGKTVTIPVAGTATYTVPTVDDGADEPNGPVTVTVVAGTGYTLGADVTGAVDVVDDDDAVPPPVVSACVSDELLATAERLYERNRHRPPAYAENWFSVLVAFGVRSPADWTADHRPIAPMTAASARTRGWRRFAAALACLEGAPPAGPVVRVTGGAAVTEGSPAT
ncbi:MAG: hypothetical protein F4142_08200, partial [Nitrospira sp. SB0675_bin_23]|nr:hypothetical protein [Nitrospira sp. SB0675_bin_23]